MIRLLIVATYVPCIISMIAQAVYRPEQGDAGNQALFQGLAIIYVIVPLNFAASPVVYMLANRGFREYLAGCAGLREKQRLMWSRQEEVETIEME